MTISKEPLGPLTPQSDSQFADIVRWTVYGLIQAEEYGITSKNVDDFRQERRAGNPALPGPGRQCHRLTAWYPERLHGDGHSSKLGNYGEIFDRNLGPDTPFKLGRGLNALWTNGGLHVFASFPLIYDLSIKTLGGRGCCTRSAT